jgi:sec-independent protein translocase protein TatA
MTVSPSAYPTRSTWCGILEVVREGAHMPSLGPVEFVIILVIFFIFFGAGKLGDFGGAVGKGIRNFREQVSGDKKDDKPAA